MNSQSKINGISRATQVKQFENQAKFVQNRVNDVERFFGDLCGEFISYTRRTAKLRNNGDEIARILVDYSVKEKFNRSTSLALKTLSEHLANIEDYRHTEIDRLVGKVVNPLASYGEEIKTVRQNIKAENAARKRETASKKKLDRSQTTESIRQAEIQLQQSINDSNQSADNLEKSIIEFEARRLTGLKSILKDYIQIEMLWHAKALESLSDAYNTLQYLHEQADLNEFQSTLMRSGGNAFRIETGHSIAVSDSRSEHPNRRLRDSSLERSRHSATGIVSHPAEDVVSLFTEDGVNYGNDQHHNTHKPQMDTIRPGHGDAASDDENEADTKTDDDDDDDDDDGETGDDEEDSEDQSEQEDEETEAEKSALSQSLHSINHMTTTRVKSLRPLTQSPLKSALKSSASQPRNTRS